MPSFPYYYKLHVFISLYIYMLQSMISLITYRSALPLPVPVIACLCELCHHVQHPCFAVPCSSVNPGFESLTPGDYSSIDRVEQHARKNPSFNNFHHATKKIKYHGKTVSKSKSDKQETYPLIIKFAFSDFPQDISRSLLERQLHIASRLGACFHEQQPFFLCPLLCLCP
jgi:hypothetical protein